jgi:hypothetical protein
MLKSCRAPLIFCSESCVLVQWYRHFLLGRSYIRNNAIATMMFRSFKQLFRILIGEGSESSVRFFIFRWRSNKSAARLNSPKTNWILFFTKVKQQLSVPYNSLDVMGGRLIELDTVIFRYVHIGSM